MTQKKLHRKIVFVFPFIACSFFTVTAETERSIQSPSTKNLRINTLDDFSILSSKRRLTPRPRPHPPGIDVDTSWAGCLDYSCEELEELWIFPGPVPSCPGLRNDGYGDYSSNCGTSGGGGSNGGGGGNSSGGSSSGGSSSGGSSSGGSSSGGGSSGGSSGGGSSGGGSSGGSSSGGSSSGGGSTGGGSSGGSSSGGSSSGGSSSGGSSSGGSSSGGSSGGSSSGGSSGGGSSSSGGSSSGGSSSSGSSSGGGGGGGGGSYQSFTMNECSTFEDYWIWDLSLTCQDSGSLENCQCATAEALMVLGLLQCPDGSDDYPFCPRDCQICETCLKLIGCSEVLHPTMENIRVTTNVFNFVVAVLGGVILGMMTMLIHQHVSKNSQREQPMERNLIADRPPERSDDHVWLAPM